MPPSSEYYIDTGGERVDDPFIDHGTAGSILVYYKLYLFFRNNPKYDLHGETN